jgi:hypothetical protein
MIISLEQWDHITEPSSAVILQEAFESLNQGLKVTVKNGGQPPYREFTRREQFEAEYRKKLRDQSDA